jgi:hypothetical protein
MNMTSLLKSSMNGLSGSSSETATEGARRATGETVSEEAARPAPEVVAIAKRRQFAGSEKRRLLAEADRRKEAGTLGAFEQMAEFREGCEDGNRRACVRLGIIIGENQERRQQWSREHPEIFSWDRDRR